jgi:hypothetical protein
MATYRTVDAEMLLLIKQQFPTHEWSDQEIRKLLDSEHGVITDFHIGRFFSWNSFALVVLTGMICPP